MKTNSLRLLIAASALSLGAAAFCADPETDPSWTKAADNKIFAQTLANEVMAGNADLLVIGIHASKPGSKDERMIASNLDRIGKIDDDDDKAGAVDGKTVLAPNLKEPNKFEVLIPMHNTAGDIIGAIGLVFKYKAGDSQVKLLGKATKIRDGLAAKLPTADDLFKPAE
jgi:hypothetical protein